MKNFPLLLGLFLGIVLGAIAILFTVVSIAMSAGKGLAKPLVAVAALAAMFVPAAALYGVARVIAKEYASFGEGLRIAAIFVFILSVPCDGSLMVMAFMK